jgi:hypothetical protein
MSYLTSWWSGESNGNSGDTETVTNVEVLSNMSLFEGLTHEDLENIGREMTTVKYAEGDIILRAGEAIDEQSCFYIITHGLCSIQFETQGVKQLKTAYELDYFGEVGLVENKPRLATVTAATDVRTICLSRKSFHDQVFHRHSSVRLELQNKIKAISALSYDGEAIHFSEEVEAMLLKWERENPEGDVHLNLTSIFGKMRQGKSFLMNLLRKNRTVLSKLVCDAREQQLQSASGQGAAAGVRGQVGRLQAQLVYYSTTDPYLNTCRYFLHLGSIHQVLDPFSPTHQGTRQLRKRLSHGMFPVSHDIEACTQGVHLSQKVAHWEQWAFGGDAANDADGATEHNKRKMLLGFMDAEGQGDKGLKNDISLITPVLLLSKVVLLNWKGAVEKDSILQLLRLLVRCAQRVMVKDENVVIENDSKTCYRFGHLHIVFRDWPHTPSGDEQKVRDMLLNIEAGDGEAILLRNQIRTELAVCFDSIKVWCLPAPSVDCNRQIPLDEVSIQFLEKVLELHSSLAEQLRDLTVFAGVPLTPKLTAKLLPGLARASGQSMIVPQTMLEHVQRQELDELGRQVILDLLHAQDVQIATGVASTDEEEAKRAWQETSSEIIVCYSERKEHLDLDLPEQVIHEIDETVRMVVCKCEEVILASRLEREEALSTAKRQFDEEKAEREASFEEEKAEREASFEEEKESLKIEFEEDKEAATKQFKERQNSLEEENEALKVENETLKSPKLNHFSGDSPIGLAWIGLGSSSDTPNELLTQCVTKKLSDFQTYSSTNIQKVPYTPLLLCFLTMLFSFFVQYKVGMPFPKGGFVHKIRPSGICGDSSGYLDIGEHAPR